MAVKHLVRGIPDRDVAFYIKEKDPKTISEVCKMYERYNALNSDEPPRKASVKGVKDPDTDPSRDQVTQQQLTTALAQAAETTNRQIQQLTNAIGQLQQPSENGTTTLDAATRTPSGSPTPRAWANATPEWHQQSAPYTMSPMRTARPLGP